MPPAVSACAFQTKFTGQQAQIIQGPTETRAVQYRKGLGFYVVNYELVIRDQLPGYLRPC